MLTCSFDRETLFRADSSNDFSRHKETTNTFDWSRSSAYKKDVVQLLGLVG